MRRLAANAVAHDGKPVPRAHGEGVEPVEIPETGAQRFVERQALGQPEGEVLGRHLAVVLGLDLLALPLQPLPQPEIVRQRAVMDEAHVVGGGEGVGALGGHRAFGRHAGVADGVGSGDTAQIILVDHLRRQALVLVDLHHRAMAHDSDVRMGLFEPAPGCRRAALDGQDAVIAAAVRRRRCSKRPCQF